MRTLGDGIPTGVGSILVYHETLVYTNSDGQQFIATANPSTPYLNLQEAAGQYFTPTPGSDLAPGNPSPYGNINTTVGPVSSFPQQDVLAYLGTSANPNLSYTLAEGDNLSLQWASIVNTYNAIGNATTLDNNGLYQGAGIYPYFLSVQNSNSVANTAALGAELPSGSGSIFSGYYTPAGGVTVGGILDTPFQNSIVLTPTAVDTGSGTPYVGLYTGAAYNGGSGLDLGNTNPFNLNAQFPDTLGGLNPTGGPANPNGEFVPASLGDYGNIPGGAAAYQSPLGSDYFSQNPGVALQGFYTPDAVPGTNPFNPGGALEQATGASSYDPGAPSMVPYTPVAVTTADFASAQTVTPTGTETVGGYTYVAVDTAAPANGYNSMLPEAPISQFRDFLSASPEIAPAGGVNQDAPLNYVSVDTGNCGANAGTLTLYSGGGCGSDAGGGCTSNCPSNGVASCTSDCPSNGVASCTSDCPSNGVASCTSDCPSNGVASCTSDCPSNGVASCTSDCPSNGVASCTSDCPSNGVASCTSNCTSDSCGGYCSGNCDDGPVVLDLKGNGININPLSRSNVFFDMANDGYEQQTAWAGAGNGVLVYDPSGGPGHAGRSGRIHALGPVGQDRHAGAGGGVRHQPRRRAERERFHLERFPHPRHQRGRHADARNPGAGGRHLDQSDAQFL